MGHATPVRPPGPEHAYDLGSPKVRGNGITAGSAVRTHEDHAPLGGRLIVHLSRRSHVRTRYEDNANIMLNRSRPHHKASLRGQSGSGMWELQA
jgi:hypothetical protein